jgi:hypothetical protein
VKVRRDARTTAGLETGATLRASEALDAFSWAPNAIAVVIGVARIAKGSKSPYNRMIAGKVS